MFTVKSQYGKIQDFDDKEFAIEFSARLALAHPDTSFHVEDEKGTTVYQAAVNKEQLDPDYKDKCVPFREIYRTTGQILSGSKVLADALRPFALRGLPDQPHPDEVH